MPAQPLSSFPSIDDPQFAPGCLAARPALAVHVLTVIEIWAHIESTILLMVSTCLKAEPVIGAAMLLAIDSQSAQRSAVLAAVKAVLPENDWPLFQAGYSAASQFRGTRNRFAHDLWGYSDKATDVLLLLSSKARCTDHFYAFDAKARKFQPGDKWDPANTRFNPDGVSVWKIRDLEEAVAEAKTANTIMSRIWHLVSNFQRGTSNDSTRKWLMSQPLVAQKIEKARLQK